MNISIVLVGMDVWTVDNKDKLGLDKSAKTVEKFCEFRKESINPEYNNDNAQLIV